MKLKPGMEYITKGGLRARILRFDSEQNIYCGEIATPSGKWQATTWNKYGEHWTPGHPSPFDLLRLSFEQKLRMDLWELIDELRKKPWHFHAPQWVADRIEALLKRHE